MSAPASVERVAIAVAVDREADRVIYKFGGQSFGLTVEYAMILVDQSLRAIEVLRPRTAPGVVQ
jgi:hypothetical protein